MSELEPLHRQPWDRLPGEPIKGYHAFALFRDMGAQRSLSKVARALVEEQSREALPDTLTAAQERKVRSVKVQLSKWSPRWQWVDRADAYLEYQDRLARDARETAITRAERYEADMAMALERMIAQRLAGDQANGIEKLSPHSIESVGDAAAVLEKATRVRRLSHGQPTDVLRGQFNITAEEHRQIVGNIFSILMDNYVPEHLQTRAAEHVRLFLETRKLT